MRSFCHDDPEVLSLDRARIGTGVPMIAGLRRNGTEPCCTSALAAVRVGRLGSGGCKIMLACPIGIFSSDGDGLEVTSAVAAAVGTTVSPCCGVLGLESGLLVSVVSAQWNKSANHESDTYRAFSHDLSQEWWAFHTNKMQVVKRLFCDVFQMLARRRLYW